MSRKAADIGRSLKRYLALHLPEDYDVRLETDPGAFERPALMIVTLPTVSQSSRRWFQITQPFTCYGYPQQGESPFDAEDKARELEDALLTSIEVGGQGGHPRRVPIFNYDGIDREHAVEGDPEGFAWVQDLSTEVRADPEEELLRTVIMEVRLRWRRLGEQPEEGPTTVTVGSRHWAYPRRAGAVALSGSGDPTAEGS